MTKKVLIPLNSGLHLNVAAASSGEYKDGLNPFEFRASFERSAYLWMHDWDDVLIPLNSGLHLNRPGVQPQAPVQS